MEGAVAKKVLNSIEEAKKSVILYLVLLWFDLDNFVDVLGEDLASYRRFKKPRPWNSSSISQRMPPSNWCRLHDGGQP
jgi:hypothetical protein